MLPPIKTTENDKNFTYFREIFREVNVIANSHEIFGINETSDDIEMYQVNLYAFWWLTYLLQYNILAVQVIPYDFKW